MQDSLQIIINVDGLLRNNPHLIYSKLNTLEMSQIDQIGAIQISKTMPPSSDTKLRYISYSTQHKTPVDISVANRHSARTSRQRGYGWEDTIVKRFNALRYWHAFRLGSPSVGLPDVLAINRKIHTLYTIEAKSGTGTTLSVPYDQIDRCLLWAKTFDLYDAHVLLAFKFLSKKRVGGGRYTHRPLHEFFKAWPKSKKATDCICSYDGTLYTNVGGHRREIMAEDAVLPFKIRH